MNVDEARAFLRDHHRGVLSTFRADGMPQLSPILAGLDAEGYATVSTREPAYKVHNLRRDPRAALCVFTEGFFGPWIQIEGTADIVSLPEAMDHLVDYYRTVAGEHPDWDDYRAAMRRERRCLIRIRIDRVGPSVSG
ncbi:PPOX class F420-dependent oxidoreductase [Actinopolymorpha sp. B11F2]|uniref:PPOX class F420-dependent oxidoreductase n=1 Tax=Actinopolymorpha sp. B11F2 TaxID=3160862 RepID=UPI0032E383EA